MNDYYYNTLNASKSNLRRMNETIPLGGLDDDAPQRASTLRPLPRRTKKKLPHLTPALESQRSLFREPWVPPSLNRNFVQEHLLETCDPQFGGSWWQTSPKFYLYQPIPNIPSLGCRWYR